VVAKVAPAVVTIRSERIVRAPRMFPFMNDPFFHDFFGDSFGAPRSRRQRGLGSGVIVTPDGYVLTNHHVIDGAEEITVELAAGRTIRAKVVGSDPPTDLAVLKVDESDLPVLTLGDSDKVRIGDVVLAIGNPLGIGQTVTAGIISAKERSTGLGDGSYESFLQTDAPINQGNSGGALVNTAGVLVGINSQILSTTGGNIGIGFAIPSNMARQVTDQLIKQGDVRRGWLGITIQNVTPDIAASLGMKDSRGVIVSSVQSGSPADRAGIRQGDVIVKLNDAETHDSNDLRNRVAAIPPGSQVSLTVLRGGSEQQIRLELGELSTDNRGGPAARGGEAEPARFGMSVSPLTPELREQLGLNRGSRGVVIVDVDPAGAAASAGLREGDLIEQVNRQQVSDPAALRNALDASGDRPALLLIQRQGNRTFVTLRPQ
jgi:Do/DeqQ family serine protease